MNEEEAIAGEDYCERCGSYNIEWLGVSGTQSDLQPVTVSWYHCNNCGFDSEAD